MKRVGIYGRVSTDGQKENTSIPEQKEKLLAYCKARDWVCVDMFIDAGYSGSTLERPAMNAMIEAIENKKVDIILVSKLDRLSRSQKDTLYMIEDVMIPNGVDFVSVEEVFDTSTPYGRAMLGILSAFAQLERELIKERTFGGRVGRAKTGLWHGGGFNPIGYDYIDGQLEINEPEAKQVRQVFDYYAAGHNVSEICRMMEGYTTKHGDWHHPGTVTQVLDNPLYIGTIHFEDVRRKGEHTAIIPEKLFHEVETKRKTVHGYKAKDSKYLLTGLVYCGNCGARYFVKQNPNKNKFYCCHSRAKVNKLMVKDPTCKNKNYPIDELEQIVFDEIKRIAANPKLIHDIKKRPPSGGKAADEVKNEISAINTEIGKLMDLYQSNDDLVQVGDVAHRIDELYQRKVSLLNKINESDITTKSSASVVSIKQLFKELSAGVESYNVRYMRYSLMRLLDKIVIEDEKITFLWSFSKE